MSKPRNRLLPVTRIVDIAKKLGLTPATVSRALKDKTEICEKTKMVRKTANRLNYHPNKITSTLRSGTTKMIGILVPSAEKLVMECSSVNPTNRRNLNPRDYRHFFQQELMGDWQLYLGPLLASGIS